jgi:hypothetical protein
LLTGIGNIVVRLYIICPRSVHEEIKGMVFVSCPRPFYAI